jgi:hypothetical protein
MSTEPSAFFERMVDRAILLIDSFPMTIEPPPMAYISGVLEPAVSLARSAMTFEEPPAATRLAVRAQLEKAAPRSAGLNTVGMLLDRLSILTVKHWNLIHRARAPEKARALRTDQIAEIIGALAEAAPGQSSINNKMTSRVVDAKAHTFGQACHGLFTTNLLLWEAQEVLYNHNIEALAADELRRYIQFFARGNLERNAYIQASDETYWRGVSER